MKGWTAVRLEEIPDRGQGWIPIRDHLGVTAFGINAIVAEVKYDNSLLDGQKCILLDYSKTSTVAERVRDEIRLIAPNTYLGRVFWNNKPTIHFALQFAG